MTSTVTVHHGGRGINDPQLVIATEQDVDQLLDELLDGPDGPRSCALLYVRDQPMINGDIPDRELKVGIDTTTRLGALHYWQQDLGHAAYSHGDQVGTEPLQFVYFGNPRKFPPDSQVDLATIRQAILEYLHTGTRPTCVRWKTYDGPVIVG